MTKSKIYLLSIRKANVIDSVKVLIFLNFGRSAGAGYAINCVAPNNVLVLIGGLPQL